MHDYYLFLHMEMVCMQFIFLFLEGGGTISSIFILIFPVISFLFATQSMLFKTADFLPLIINTKDNCRRKQVKTQLMLLFSVALHNVKQTQQSRVLSVNIPRSLKTKFGLKPV